jgi:hypothetical protein
MRKVAVAQQAAVQVGLGVAGRQLQELQRVGVLEGARRRVAVDFSHRW